MRNFNRPYKLKWDSNPFKHGFTQFWWHYCLTRKLIAHFLARRDIYILWLNRDHLCCRNITVDGKVEFFVPFDKDKNMRVIK